MSSFLDREYGAWRGGLYVVRRPQHLHVTYRLPYVVILFIEDVETEDGFGFRCFRGGCE